MFHKHLIGAALLICLLAACGGGGSSGPVAPAANTASGAPPQELGITAAMQDGLQKGLDAAWVYVDEGGGSVETYFAGTEDLRTGEPAKADALFKIASISKLFIAVSAVKLLDTGTLQLEDTVAFWLPSLGDRLANAQQINLRQLLQHRSGVPDFDSEPGFSWEVAHTDLDALLALVVDDPADFSPDERYAYSNTNYLLLGMILDAALGYSHHDFVRNEILSPLGMVNTVSLLSEVDASLLVRGYWDGVDRTTQDYVVPGGSMISTVGETGAFLRALATGTLLSDAQRDLYLDLFANVGHSGWLPGYQSIAYYFEDIDTVVVQFVNNTGGTSEASSQDLFDSVVDSLYD
ncbi:MAG: serine hydrolase domain-containing protein [Pseudomonadota bacterium]